MELYTPYDITDLNGNAEAVLPTGEYNIVVIPPAETNLRTGRFSDLLLQNDSSLVLKLFTRPASSDGNNFIIKQNFPNPFNATTNIYFEILSLTDVQIDVYNILGQKVKNLTNRKYSPGEYAIQWDGSNKQGKKTASGVYFYRIVTSQGSDSRTIVLLK